MRATMSPTEISVRHADPGDDTWTHTLEAEDESGASVSLLLSSDAFQALWKSCEDPRRGGGVSDGKKEIL